VAQLATLTAIHTIKMCYLSAKNLVFAVWIRTGDEANCNRSEVVSKLFSLCCSHTSS